MVLGSGFTGTQLKGQNSFPALEGISHLLPTLRSLSQCHKFPFFFLFLFVITFTLGSNPLLPLLPPAPVSPSAVEECGLGFFLPHLSPFLSSPTNLGIFQLPDAF